MDGTEAEKWYEWSDNKDVQWQSENWIALTVL